MVVIDRYLAICHPHRHIASTRCKWFMLGAAVAGLCLSLPSLAAYNVYQVPTSPDTDVDKCILSAVDPIGVIYKQVLVAVYMLTIVVQIVAYSAIYRKIMMREKRKLTVVHPLVSAHNDVISALPTCEDLTKQPNIFEKVHKSSDVKVQVQDDMERKGKSRRKSVLSFIVENKDKLFTRPQQGSPTYEKSSVQSVKRKVGIAGHFYSDQICRESDKLPDAVAKLTPQKKVSAGCSVATVGTTRPNVDIARRETGWRGQQKSAYLFSLITTAYAISWSVYILEVLGVPIHHVPHHRILHHFYFINNIINPALCFAFNASIRSNLLYVVTCGKCGSKSGIYT